MSADASGSSRATERARRPASRVEPQPVLGALRPLWDVDASGWFAYGPDGRLVYVNRAFERLTGSRPEIGTAMLVPEVAAERRLAFRRSFHRLRAGDEAAASWIVPVAVNGIEKPLQISLTAIGDRADRAHCVVGVVSPLDGAQDGAAGVVAERERLLEQVLGRVMRAVSTVLPDQDDVMDELGWNDLSGRQREVLRLLLRGDRASAIAAALHLSTHTVRNYEKAIFRKFGVHSQAELIALSRAMRRHPSVRARAAIGPA